MAVEIYGTKEELKLVQDLMNYGVANITPERVDFLIANGNNTEVDCNYHVLEPREVEQFISHVHVTGKVV